MNENNDPRLPRHFAVYGCMPAIRISTDMKIRIQSVPQRKTFGWHGAPPSNQNRRSRRIFAVKI